jgi:MerR family transcriptional regulator/heat shock protein HspR
MTELGKSDRDITRLRRINELTAEGLNLEGVRRVMALEEENDRLRQAVVQAQREAREAVERTHRQYRRDLVPLDQSPVLYRRGR